MVLHIQKIKFGHKIAMEKAQRNKLCDRIMGIEFIQLAKFWNYEEDNEPLGSTKTENFFTSWATIIPPKVAVVNFTYLLHGAESFLRS